MHVTEGLQQKINRLRDYCLKWKLRINIKKTKVLVVVFNQKGFQGGLNFYLNDHKLENANEYKYLGITLSSNGLLSTARDCIYKKASREMFKLKSCIRQANISPRLGLKLFDQLIKPICLYRCEIWGYINLTTKQMKDEHWLETRGLCEQSVLS